MVSFGSAIEPHLPANQASPGRKSDGLFLEVILFVIYKWFARWAEDGVWQRVFGILTEGKLDMGEASIDSTVAGRTNTQPEPGPTTRIHAVVDSIGRLIHFLLTGGNANDCTQGVKLLETVPAENVLGDKAYDTNDRYEKLSRAFANLILVVAIYLWTGN